MPQLRRRSAVAYLNTWGGVVPQQIVEQEIAKLLLPSTDRPELPVLVLDQLEDIFKLDHDRKLFWNMIGELVNIDDPRLHVLVAIREEWIGSLEEASDYIPALYDSLFRLPPLSETDLKRAIECPPQEFGVSMEAGLADTLLRDLRAPSAFGLGVHYTDPGLLQLVCKRLWTETRKLGMSEMTVAVYAGLGRAEWILRNFVWDHLRTAGSKKSVFSPLDRAFFVGVIKHLTLAHGVKAVVTASGVSRKLRMTDFGVLVSPILVDYELDRRDRKYLLMPPPRRPGTPPPIKISSWVTRVLNQAVSAGFVRKYASVTGGSSYYELTHDSFGPLLEAFAAEFQKWVDRRVYFGISVLIGVPLYAFAVWTVMQNFKQPLVLALIYTLLGFGAYLGLIFVLVKILEWFFEAIFFAPLRLLVRGDPIKKRVSR
jgi:hypothetical protein